SVLAAGAWHAMLLARARRRKDPRRGRRGPAMAEPRPLPSCSYPSAIDVAQHGLQILPPSLPLVDFERARPHRSLRYAAMPASYLTPLEVVQLADVVGTSFARREPQCRHLQLATVMPDEL